MEREGWLVCLTCSQGQHHIPALWAAAFYQTQSPGGRSLGPRDMQDSVAEWTLPRETPTQAVDPASGRTSMFLSEKGTD
jgi:hypothetical protein